MTQSKGLLAQMKSSREAGSVVWAVLIAAVATLLVGMFVATTINSSERSRENMHTVLTTQRTDAAVADAIARLSSGASVPATRADASPVCQELNGRGVCYQYWALPLPGQAVDPVRYNLVTNTWIDKNRDGTYPANGDGVRAVVFPIEAITYQTGEGLDPTSVDGQIRYVASPAGLFNNAIHGFSDVTLNGPKTDVTSYNSLNTDTATKGGVVSSGGFVAYGRETSAHLTKLYGHFGAGGVQTSRCTGEVCGESDVQALTYSYAAPDEKSVKWIRDATCTTTVDNWVASENNAVLPTGTLCVNGNLVIDAPTKLEAAAATVYVRGNIDIRESLNAPDAGRIATPGRLAIYSAGQYVAFTPQVATDPGLGVAALLWAPRATCTTDPGNIVSPNAGDSTGAISYFGSLVCDVVSIGGSWNHQLDTAQTVSYIDPVPGSKKSWTVGNPIGADTSEQWDTPPGWQESLCVLPNPDGATHYWKLSEPSGLAAIDFAGSNTAAWAASASGRGDGLCGKAAALSSGGTVSSGQKVVSATQGVSVEWWGRSTVGAVVQSAGVSVSMDATRHLSVTSGGKTVKFPFTVQAAGNWHLYSVTVANDGTATLYVDGEAKETVMVGTPSAGGSTVLAKGTAGVISDVVVYSRNLSDNEVRDRWSTWLTNVVFTPSNPGLPFTAPRNLVDAGSTDKLLSMSWTRSTGTLTNPDAVYSVQRSTSATSGFTQIATVPMGTTTFSQTNPTQGSFFYRVCTVMNGDSKCSNVIDVDTIPTSAAPANFGFSTDYTALKTTLSWDAVPFAQRYEVQYVLHGQTVWSGAGGVEGAVYNYGLGTSVNPSFAWGRSWKARIRTVNATGTSAWSPAVTHQVRPAVPTVTTGTPTTTTGVFNWNQEGFADSYEYQMQLLGSANDPVGWFGPSNVVGAIYETTAKTRSVTSSQHGTRWSLRVRALTADGQASAWSSTGITTQTVALPTFNSYAFGGSQADASTTTNMLVTCGPGTNPYTRMRDKLSTWTAWNAWTAWSATAATNRTASFKHKYGTGPEAAAALNVQYEVACRNAKTAALSGASARAVNYSASTASGFAANMEFFGGGSKSLRYDGWAYHKNNPAASNLLDSWSDKGTSSAKYMSCWSDRARADVKKAYPVTGNFQGFGCTMTGLTAGPHNGLVYGINQFGQAQLLRDGAFNAS